MVLLALSYQEQGEKEKAVKYCQDAIEIFEGQERADLVEQAKGYLEELK